MVRGPACCPCKTGASLVGFFILVVINWLNSFIYKHVNDLILLQIKGRHSCLFSILSRAWLDDGMLFIVIAQIILF